MSKELALNDKISDKHKLLIAAYFTHHANKTHAYMAVYPDASQATARSAFCNILVANPRVKEALDRECVRQLALMDTKYIASREYMLQEAHEIGLKAKEEGKLDTALRSVDQKAKLTGAYSEKKDDKHYNVFINKLYSGNKTTKFVEKEDDDGLIDV